MYVKLEKLVFYTLQKHTFYLSAKSFEVKCYLFLEGRSRSRDRPTLLNPDTQKPQAWLVATARNLSPPRTGN